MIKITTLSVIIWRWPFQPRTSMPMERRLTADAFLSTLNEAEPSTDGYQGDWVRIECFCRRSKWPSNCITITNYWSLFQKNNTIFGINVYTNGRPWYWWWVAVLGPVGCKNIWSLTSWQSYKKFYNRNLPRQRVVLQKIYSSKILILIIKRLSHWPQGTKCP